jgi:site-specific DNA-methyltransferase (adenine-specific)
MINLIKGECLVEMSGIPDKSVDVILADLPYAQTQNPWDKMLPLDLLWAQYKRIIKDSGIIILFGQGVFSAKLILSNEKMYRYTIIWEKTTPTGHLNAKRMPLRNHEDILVFYSKLPTYNPQKTTGHERKVSSSTHKRNCTETENYGKHELTSYDSTERYPKSVWKFATDKQKSALHSTQKPLKLIEELIKTFSNEGDIVLDNTMGSGTTGEACINLKRNFIGMELDPLIFQIAESRILHPYL